MKRFVKAGIISALMAAIAAAAMTSCAWMPDPEEPETQVEIPTDALSVGELLASGRAGDTLWVWGYVVGAILKEKTVIFGCDSLVPANNLALAGSPSAEAVDSCMAVQLTKSAHKAALSLADTLNRPLLHRKLYVRGKVSTYKKFISVTNLCEYLIE